MEHGGKHVRIQPVLVAVNTLDPYRNSLLYSRAGRLQLSRYLLLLSDSVGTVNLVLLYTHVEHNEWSPVHYHNRKHFRQHGEDPHFHRLAE